MIEDLEPKTVVMTGSSIEPGTIFDLVMSFTAQQDLTLRGVVFTGTKQQLLTIDADLTPLVKGQQNSDFQLLAIDSTGIGSQVFFNDLAFPLAKGQTLYWGNQGADCTIQLFFS